MSTLQCDGPSVFLHPTEPTIFPSSSTPLAVTTALVAHFHPHRACFIVRVFYPLRRALLHPQRYSELRYLHSHRTPKKCRRFSRIYAHLSGYALRGAVVSCIHSYAEEQGYTYLFLPTPHFSFYRPSLFLHPVFILLSSSNSNILSISSFSSPSFSPTPFLSLSLSLLSPFLLFYIRGGYCMAANFSYNTHDVMKKFDFAFDKCRQIMSYAYISRLF